VVHGFDFFGVAVFGDVSLFERQIAAVEPSWSAETEIIKISSLGIFYFPPLQTLPLQREE